MRGYRVQPPPSKRPKPVFQVTLIDENPVPPSIAQLNVPLFFGQRFEDALSDRAAMMERVATSNEALREAEEAGVDIQLGTCVWGRLSQLRKTADS